MQNLGDKQRVLWYFSKVAYFPLYLKLKGSQIAAKSKKIFPVSWDSIRFLCFSQ